MASSSPSFRELDDVFLQCQARIWVGEVLHTRFDEQLSIGDLLSDGELLFEVSKALWNMLLVKYMELKSYKARMFVPVDTRKSSGRYRPYSNVDSFLKVCKVMGLSGVDLFSPSDVVEKRNTRKVCVCIRSLSKKARSKQLNVPNFDIVTNTVAMSTDAVRCIRRSLELSSMSGVTCGQSKHARLKSRKLIFASHEQDESYIEESDEENSQFSDTSYVDLLYLESGESPDIADKYALTQSDASNRELDKFAHTPRSVLLHYVNKDNQLEETLSNFCESGLILCDEFTSINHGRQFLHDNGENPQNMGEVDHRISLSRDCLCHSCMATESHNSNTSPDSSVSRVWRKLPDDAETSPAISVLGRVLDFDVDFDFDAKSKLDDLTTLESSTYDNVSVKDDVTNIADSMQENMAGVKFGERYDCCVAEDTSNAAGKEERKDTNDKSKGRYMAPLLKTIAKGTALIGILFLLQLRNRSDRITNSKSTQIHWKSIGVEFSKRKEEKGSKIYPVEKFKFED